MGAPSERRSEEPAGNAPAVSLVQNGGEVLAAVLDYAAAAMPVLPLAGKVPRTANGLTDASANLDQVVAWWKRWPTANVGVVTGSASGFVVLDVDGAAGARSLAELERQHGAIRTAEVVTGSGGRHLYFRCPEYLVRNSTGALGEGLDVRGESGYVVAPPSKHAKHGGRYTWTRELEHAVVWPDWLRALAPARNGPASAVERVIAAGRRNAELASVAGTLRRRGLEADEILGALVAVNAARCRPPLTKRELEQIATSVARYEPAAELGAPAHTGPRLELEELVATFRRWLHMPDPGALYIVLACVVANRLPGDPALCSSPPRAPGRPRFSSRSPRSPRSSPRRRSRKPRCSPGFRAKNTPPAPRAGSCARSASTES